MLYDSTGLATHSTAFSSPTALHAVWRFVPPTAASGPTIAFFQLNSRSKSLSDQIQIRVVFHQGTKLYGIAQFFFEISSKSEIRISKSEMNVGRQQSRETKKFQNSGSRSHPFRILNCSLKFGSSSSVVIRAFISFVSDFGFRASKFKSLPFASLRLCGRYELFRFSNPKSKIQNLKSVDGQRKGKGRALPDLALHPDLPPMQLDKLLRQS